MELSAVRQQLESEFTFPLDRERLLERAGDVELEGVPAETETIGAVLERTDEQSFVSAKALSETLVGTVDGAYVGRKYYDDRSGEEPIAQERTVHSL